ncbi:hypothetical protein [Streptomyces coeruleorubidus]
MEERLIERRGPARWLRPMLRGLFVTLIGGVSVVMVATVALAIGPLLLVRMDTPARQAWCTVFAAIAVQGLPLFGTLVSAAIGALVPASVFSRVLPRNPAPAAPGCGRGRCGAAPLRVRLGAGGGALDAVRVTKTAEPKDPYTDSAADIARS